MARKETGREKGLRTGSYERETKETKASARVELDGRGEVKADTGIGFLDHMLEALGKHAGWNMEVKTRGDLEVDGHHTVEDTGMVLGTAVRRALGDARGIRRFGSAYAPLDEACVRAVADVSGRGWLAWEVKFTRESLGGLDTQLVEEWFRAFARTSGMTMHITAVSGRNAHHMAEAAFKATACALREALALDEGRGGAVPSTKGSLDLGE